MNYIPYGILDVSITSFDALSQLLLLLHAFLDNNFPIDKLTRSELWSAGIYYYYLVLPFILHGLLLK